MEIIFRRQYSWSDSLQSSCSAYKYSICIQCAISRAARNVNFMTFTTRVLILEHTLRTQNFARSTHWFRVVSTSHTHARSTLRKEGPEGTVSQLPQHATVSSFPKCSKLAERQRCSLNICPKPAVSAGHRALVVSAVIRILHVTVISAEQPARQHKTELGSLKVPVPPSERRNARKTKYLEAWASEDQIAGWEPAAKRRSGTALERTLKSEAATGREGLYHHANAERD